LIFELFNGIDELLPEENEDFAFFKIFNLILGEKKYF